MMEDFMRSFLDVPESITFASMPFQDTFEIADDELSISLQRHVHPEFSDFISVDGRVACLKNAVLHSIAVVCKPTLYLSAGMCQTASRPKSYAVLGGSAAGAIASFFGQTIETIKSVVGLVHPGVYYRSPTVR
jgi:hypothetical protein